MPNDKIISIRNIDQLLTNEDYRKYWEKKQLILQDYPPQKDRTRQQHRECMKRIGDLMWDINGDFQKFVDSQISEIDTIKQERRARGRKNKTEGDSYSV